MISSKKIKYANRASRSIGYFAFGMAVYLFVPLAFYSIDKNMMHLLSYAISCIVLLFMWHQYKQNKIFGGYVIDERHVMPLHSVALFGAWMALAFMFVPASINFIIALQNLGKAKWQAVLVSLAIGFSAGICEEILFRGYLFGTFLALFKKNEHPLMFAGLISAFLFGATHLVNLTHQNLNSTLTQVVLATFMGLLIVIVRIYTNSIYFGMLYHVIQDFSVVMITGGNVNNPAAGKYLPYIAGISLVMILLFSQCLRGMDNQMRLFRRLCTKTYDYDQNRDDNADDDDVEYDESDRIRWREGISYMFVFDKGKFKRQMIFTHIRLNTLRRVEGFRIKEFVWWAIGIALILALFFSACIQQLENRFMNHFFDPSYTRTIPPFNQTVINFNVLNSTFSKYVNYVILYIICLILLVYVALFVLAKSIYKQDKAFGRMVALKPDTLFNSDDTFMTIFHDAKSTDRDLAKFNHPTRVVSFLCGRVPFVDVVGNYIVCYDIKQYN